MQRLYLFTLLIVAVIGLACGLQLRPVGGVTRSAATRLSAAKKPPTPPEPKKKELGFNLYTARRVTRWAMFPGIFKDFDATEERMKPTIFIENKKLSKREKEYQSIRYSDKGLEPEEVSFWDKLRGR